MALTPAEKQRRYRERLRTSRPERERKAADLTPVRASDFSAFMTSPGAEQDIAFIGETFAAVGFDFPDLTKDIDPEWTEDWGVENRGALGKAERMVDAMIDSAKSLSEVINRFKLQQVEAAKARLLKRTLSTADAKRRATEEAVRLDKIESRLRKEVRHSFHPMAVKGEV